MKRTLKEDIKNLKAYKKEEILEALEYTGRYRAFHINLITADMVSYLENKKRKEVFAAHDKALEAEREAIVACQKWNNEMIEKYGDGMSVKLADLPPDELERGAALERRMKEAIKKERALDTKINRLLEI